MPDWRHAIAGRLEALRLPPTREADVIEELSQHLDDRYEELRGGGASADEARREALAEVDEADLVRELTGIHRPPDEPFAIGGGSPGGPLAGLWQDLCFGARMLAKDAGAAVVIVLTLALAIAANTIVFGLADLILLRPLPFGNAARLVTIYGMDQRQTQNRQGLSIPDYLQIRAACAACDDVLAMRRGQVSLTGSGEPMAVQAEYATANAFQIMDVSTSSGRLLRPGEDQPGRDRVAVLAHHFWAARFAGDPGVVGRDITVNGGSFTVVGVMTPDIEIGNVGEIDLWLPLATNPAATRGERSLTVMALLKRGAALPGVNAELATIGARLQQEYPATNANVSLRAMSLRESTVGRSTWIILALLGVVVGLVLLVACANVATVMLARASARRREIAVRLALGATRGRLVRQLVSEGLLLGLASGALGVLLAYGGLTAFKALSPETFFQRLTINFNLLTFAFFLSVLAPVLFGVLPALQSSRPNLNEDLKDGGRDPVSAVRGNRSRSGLVVAQVAFALAVLIASGLIVRTVNAIEQVPLGMNPGGLLALRVRLDPPKYEDEAARLRAVESILVRLSGVRGVTAASAMQAFPIVDGEPLRQFAVVGRPAARAGDTPWANEAAVSGDYGRVLALPLLEGRSWQPGDRASGWAVAIVNREAVRRYWPSQSPIGERITMLDAKGQPDGAPITIVGVVDNVIGAEPSEPPPPRVYRPLALRVGAGVGVLIRASGDPASLAPAVRDALRAEDRDLAVSEVRTVQSLVDQNLRTYTLIMSLFAGFSAIGLLVAITGVYGVTAFSVGQRRHEIGVRIALGATPGDVLRLIVGRSFRLIGIGAVLGVAAGWAIALTMRNILYGVGAADPVTYAAVIGLVALCGLAACYAPARHATQLDPMAALRTE